MGLCLEIFAVNFRYLMTQIDKQKCTISVQNDKWSCSSQQFGSSCNWLILLISPWWGSVIFKAHRNCHFLRERDSLVHHQVLFGKYVICQDFDIYCFHQQIIKTIALPDTFLVSGECCTPWMLFWHISPFQEKCILFSSGWSAQQRRTI